MFRIDEYIDELTDKLINAFGKRLEHVGLQGSYLRHEETKNSDIDIMVVIDNISVEDLNTYQKSLISMGNYDKSCGFICGKTDLEHWNPLEIFHLLKTTKDYYGELKNLVPTYTIEDERNYVKLSDRLSSQVQQNQRKNFLSTSKGVRKLRRFLGRLLIISTKCCRSSSVTSAKEVPFGKNCRSRPLVFSFVPRCQGE